MRTISEHRCFKNVCINWRLARNYPVKTARLARLGNVGFDQVVGMESAIIPA
jgi:hypothetical protein